MHHVLILINCRGTQYYPYSLAFCNSSTPMCPAWAITMSLPCAMVMPIAVMPEHLQQTGPGGMYAMEHRVT